ncbi:MAG: choice-of-anchor M domain-containing protein [Planctomycetota bacterium]
MNRRALWLMSVCMFAITACLVVSTAEAELVEYSAGHADISLEYESGELDLHYHFGVGSFLDGERQTASSRVHPSDAYVRVPDSTMGFGGAVDFLGTGPLDPVWVLPFGNVSGVPYIGINFEDVRGLGFTTATLAMTDFEGPGEFAQWQIGLFVTNVSWQTNDGIGVNPGDDVLPFPIGGHDHHDRGFTKQGVYDIELTATAFFGDGTSVSDTETFRFVVGDATSVPEPLSFGPLLLGAAAFGLRRGRRP